MGMYLDGILTAPHIDTSGEILDIDGVDLTDFYEGKAVINFEHQNKLAEDIIGAFVFCKKILKKEDCETDRQKMFFELAKGPYVYVIGELFDDQGHPGAVAAAAMVRYFAKRKIKMFIGWSIEGSTLERDGNNLKRAVARRAAFTLRPCLKSAEMGVPEEAEIEKFLKKMNKSESELYEIDADKLILSKNDIPKASTFSEIIKDLQDLNKTTVAGSHNVAPGQLVGSAALTKEYLSGPVKNIILAALRDREKGKPIKMAIKAALPEVSDKYIDHFADLAEDLALKKGMKPLHRIGPEHVVSNSDESQKALVDGIYHSDTNFKNTKNKIDQNKTCEAVNDKGVKVLIKAPVNLEQVQNSSLFYKIAKNFFETEDHVPITALIRHDKINNGLPLQIIESVDGKTPYESSVEWQKALDLGKMDGSLQKIVILDDILGTLNRSKANVLIGSDGKIKLIDNDKTFKHEAPYSELHEVIKNDPVKPEVKEWIESKDHKVLAKMLYNNGCSPECIRTSILKLLSHKKNSKLNKNIYETVKENAAHLEPKEDLNG